MQWLCVFVCACVYDSQPSPCVLVIGIDCCLSFQFHGRHVPADEPIDLINVAFEQERKPRQPVSHHSRSIVQQAPSAERRG